MNGITIYKRYNFSKRAYEIRTCIVEEIKKTGNTIQTFVFDTHDYARNCIAYRNGKNISIGVDFA